MNTSAHPADTDGVDTTLFDFSDDEPKPDNACINYPRCENIVPHSGEMCGECLDSVRQADVCSPCNVPSRA
jgi:hypothetical protein